MGALKLLIILFITLSPLWYFQIIVGGVASTPEEVRLYASCTLLAASLAAEGASEGSAAKEKERSRGAIEACIEWLMENEFIHIQKDKDVPGRFPLIDFTEIQSVFISYKVSSSPNCELVIVVAVVL